MVVSSRYDLQFAYTWVSVGGIPGYEVYGNLSAGLAFTANLSAAGTDGKGLAPGTCAWVDRPLAAAEPRVLHYRGRVPPGLSMAWETRDGRPSTPTLSGSLDEMTRDSGRMLHGEVKRVGDSWALESLQMR